MRFKETPLAELLKLIKEQKEQKRIREQMEKKQNDTLSEVRIWDQFN